jgi:hypothetical protein
MIVILKKKFQKNENFFEEGFYIPYGNAFVAHLGNIIQKSQLGGRKKSLWME